MFALPLWGWDRHEASMLRAPWRAWQHQRPPPMPPALREGKEEPPKPAKAHGRSSVSQPPRPSPAPGEQPQSPGGGTGPGSSTVRAGSEAKGQVTSTHHGSSCQGPGRPVGLDSRGLSAVHRGAVMPARTQGAPGQPHSTPADLAQGKSRGPDARTLSLDLFSPSVS